MYKSKTAHWLAVLTFVATSSVAMCQSSATQARSLLLRTMSRNHAQNVTAVITQRMSDGSSAFQQIRVQISRDGKMRKTVTAPLSMQGVETVDNGREWKTYLPDQRILLIQDSPNLLPDDSSKRIALAARNYTLRVSGTERIAGRTATIVVASPVKGGLDTRRYYIDEPTGFLMRLETVDSGGRAQLQFDTKQVQFPEKLATDTFDIRPVGKLKMLRFQRKENLYPHQLGRLPFQPVLPKTLPYGFAVSEVQLADEQGGNAVVVRLTDGLVSAQVYQWPSRITRVSVNQAVHGVSRGTGGGLKILVAAEIPEGVREELVNSFASEAGRNSEYHPIPMGTVSRSVEGRELGSMGGTLSLTGSLHLRIRGVGFDETLMPITPAILDQLFLG